MVQISTCGGLFNNVTYWGLCHCLNVCWVIMFLLEGQYVYEQMYCMYVCMSLWFWAGTRVFLEVCVCVSGGSLWVVTCLCPIHVAFCQVLTNAFVVLPIVRLSCEFHFLCAILISLTMPIKGNVFEKKTKKLFSFSGFPIIFLSLWWMYAHQALLYQFQSALWNDYDLCSLWLLSRRHPWSFLKGRFKSYENNACCKCGFTINSSSLPPALIYQSVEWKLTDAGGMTQAHPQHICLSLKFLPW